MNIKLAILKYSLRNRQHLLGLIKYVSATHMLGMNVFLKRLVLKRSVAKALERLSLYVDDFLEVVTEKAYALDLE